jgi:hypothetical protein
MTNNNIASDATNSAKNLAQRIAKQLAQEPVEILKDVREQATGEALGKGEQKPQDDDQKPDAAQTGQMQEQDRLKSVRMIEALNRELDDIRKQELFKELQQKIAEGEEVSLQEYPELSMEQKQVLIAQMEAVKQQRALQAQSFKEVPAITSKPSRRFGAGQKQQAQKEQTRVEKPVPPSG